MSDQKRSFLASTSVSNNLSLFLSSYVSWCFQKKKKLLVRVYLSRKDILWSIQWLEVDLAFHKRKIEPNGSRRASNGNLGGHLSIYLEHEINVYYYGCWPPQYKSFFFIQALATCKFVTVQIRSRALGGHLLSHTQNQLAKDKHHYWEEGWSSRLSGVIRLILLSWLALIVILQDAIKMVINFICSVEGIVHL